MIYSLFSFENVKIEVCLVRLNLGFLLKARGNYRKSVTLSVDSFLIKMTLPDMTLKLQVILYVLKNINIRTRNMFVLIMMKQNMPIFSEICLFLPPLHLWGNYVVFVIVHYHTYTLQCCNPWGCGKLGMTEQKQQLTLLCR